MNSLHTADNEAPLCSETYLDFYNVISENFQSVEALCTAISTHISPIAQKLRIGYLALSLDAPKTHLTPEGRHVAQAIYHTLHDKSKMRTLHFRTAEDGMCIAMLCPTLGHTWTDEEFRMVQFLLKNLFVLCGRSRMGTLLERATSYDFMTNAINTKAMIEYGSILKARGQLSAYVGIFLNLRNFKYINQTVGPSKGDEILIRYTSTVQGLLQPDERLARPGGDNFFALVRREHADEFLEFISEIPMDVQFDEFQRTFMIAASIGAYDIGPDDVISQVLNFATIALNEVKHSSRDVHYLWYRPEMLQQIMHDKQISQLFPKALRSGEFIVYFQPKVALDSLQLCGCEALARWSHDGRIVMPMDFIPILEKEGTICKLDLYVFEQVCKTIRRWQDEGITPVRVSVNFSQQHLQNDTLADRIVSIMEQYEVDSRFIEVELTEMTGAKNHDAMLRFLKKMRDHGIATSIDDFGTGFSSLNMLREFQMDVIKLDKSFLDRIAAGGNNRGDEIVIENIVRMVQALDLQIISEGVETRRQADFLRHVRCNMAQGFLFDKPLPSETFEARLKGDRCYTLPTE
ncbi:MAG: GGDEF domain-containing protein [Oscillospiraceae bacterium]|nr:GGDEF domain-containing protein [Oscillospiraceae bacterium]